MQAGLTPLTIASNIGNVKVVKMLLSAGADKEAKDEVGNACLTL